MYSHNNTVCVGQADVSRYGEHFPDDIHHMDFDFGFDFSDDFSVYNATTASSFDSIDSEVSSGNLIIIHNFVIFLLLIRFLPLQSSAPASITPLSEVQSGKEVVSLCEKLPYRNQNP